MRIPPAVIDEHCGGKGDEVQDKKHRNNPTVLLSPRQRPEEGERNPLLLKQVFRREISGDPRPRRLKRFDIHLRLEFQIIRH